jgi:SlyX protein
MTFSTLPGSAPIPPEVDQRLTALEIKASFAEDLLDQLNLIVTRQQQQIDRLQREVVELRRQAAESVAAPAFRSLRDELPPHY